MEKNKLQEYLDDIRRLHRNNLRWLPVFFVVASMGFYSIYIYSKKFPEINKEMSWEAVGHQLEQTYYWAKSWITDPANIPGNQLKAYLIFIGFWMFFLFLCMLEPYFIRMEAWEEVLEEHGYSKEDFK
jgi:hypothetical protein